MAELRVSGHACAPSLPLRTQVRATDVELPEGACFVIANSLAVSKKAEAAPRR